MTRHFVPIELEGSYWLVDARGVREILGNEPWLPIPRSLRELPGVIAWRGRAVPVVDLGRVLGVAEQPTQAGRARTLIVEHEQGVAAIPVDSAREVRAIEEEELKEVLGAPHPYSAREVDTEGHIMPVVDVAALLADLHRTAAEDRLG